MLDWKEYVDDVRELIPLLDSTDSYGEFCAQLVEGLEDTDENIKVITYKGKPAIYFHGCILKDKREADNYFKLQNQIPIADYDKVRQLAEDSGRMREFVQSLQNCYKDREIGKYFNKTVVIENKHYHSKDEIYNAFEPSVTMQEIKDLCNHVDKTRDGQGIVCDGVALITTSLDYIRNPQRLHYKLEGYLDNKGKLSWVTVNPSAFRTVQTDGGDIQILRSFQDAKYTFYRFTLMTDLGVIKKPYPVAILKDGVYAFYYRRRI